MTRLWWVRHGPTEADGMIGWTDVPAVLTDRDRLSRLSGHLPAAPVISSDLLRARATADALQDGRPRLEHDPDLRELNFGMWEAQRFKDIETAALMAFYDCPGETRPPDGESWNEISARVSKAADRLAAAGHPDVIVVSHMGAILTQVQRALGLSGKEAFSQRIDNLSITCLAFDGTWTAETINHHP